MWSGLHFIASFTTLSSPLLKLEDGLTFNHGEGINCQNEEVHDGDMWMMEVDLRSREKEKRTLHWFVRGKQQKGFIYGVPDRVEFAV